MIDWIWGNLAMVDNMFLCSNDEKSWIEILTSHNCASWNKLVWNYLIGKGYLGYPKETISQPTDPNSLLKWDIQREKTLGCICSLVSYDWQFHIESCKIPKELWETLETLYGKIDKIMGY